MTSDRMVDGPNQVEAWAEPTIEIVVGTATRAELLTQLAAADVGLNDHARWLLRREELDNVRPERISVCLRSALDLGLPRGGTWAQLLAAAADRGLTPPPLAAGPQLRLVLADQPDAPDSVLSAGRPPSGAIHVASPRTDAGEDEPRGFYLRTVDGRRWLRGFRCDDDYVLGPETVLALRRPSSTDEAHGEDCPTRNHRGDTIARTDTVCGSGPAPSERTLPSVRTP